MESTATRADLNWPPDWKPVSWWELRASYSYLNMDLKNKSWSNDPGTVAGDEGSTPRNQLVIQSLVTLPKKLNSIRPSLCRGAARPGGSKLRDSGREVGLALCPAIATVRDRQKPVAATLRPVRRRPRRPGSSEERRLRKPGMAAGRLTSTRTSPALICATHKTGGTPPPRDARLSHTRPSTASQVVARGDALAFHAHRGCSAPHRLQRRGQKKPTQYQVEATYLYNFSQFVAWPPSPATATSSFNICVLGQDPFGSTLANILAD